MGNVLRVGTAVLVCFVGVGCADGDAPPINDPAEQQPFAAVLAPGEVGVVSEEGSGDQAAGDTPRDPPIRGADDSDQQMLPPE